MQHILTSDILQLYGLFSGALVSLPPTIFVHLTKNRAVIGTRMGMGFAIISIGLLVGKFLLSLQKIKMTPY